MMPVPTPVRCYLIVVLTCIFYGESKWVQEKKSTAPLTKIFNYVNHNKLWKIRKETGVPSLPPGKPVWGREATIRIRHGTTNWFQIVSQLFPKLVPNCYIPQGCILSPCLFNLYAEYIKWNARLGESQAGIKISGRNVNNISYADYTTLMVKVKRNQRGCWWEWRRRVKKLA